MSAHTPGPWIVSGPFIVNEGDPKQFRAFIIEADTPEGRAVLGYITANGTDLPQARVDAAVFAAAPELLEKLKRAGRELALLGKGRPSIESLVDEIGDLVNQAEGA